MERFWEWCLMALVAAPMAIGMTACSDDDDDDNGGGGGGSSSSRSLKSVYTIEDGQKSYDYTNPTWKSGKLASYSAKYWESANEVWHNETYSIDYKSGNQAVITCTFVEDGYTETESESISLNNAGYMIDGFGMECNYNSSGQLTSWSGDGSCTITWNADGDISSTYSRYNGTVNLSYTNSKVTSAIENKGGLMLLDEWGVMWDWEYFAYFGIYGVAPKHLPVKAGGNTFDWTLDSKGYPSQVAITDDEGDTETIYFEWQ